jgi:hypothetical protein
MSEQPHVPPGVDPDILHRVVTVSAETRNLDGMQHEGQVRQFTFISRSRTFWVGRVKGNSVHIEHVADNYRRIAVPGVVYILAKRQIHRVSDRFVGVTDN